ncbi:MAG: phosphatase PAP2 family protein [Clostridia bacterium]|nr:phosphatase PAP2 family protein [Clostridia bacterium]
MAFLHLLESIRNPALDTFFQLITLFGEETLFIIFGLLFFWCIDKYEGFFLLCIGLLGTVINQFLKLLFRIPRPWVRDPSFTIVESAREAATGYSFPSGHTQTSVGVYGGIARWTGKGWLSRACLLLCVLVPLSRMYLGVHTPADVGVSILVALALIFLLYPIVRKGCADARVMRPLFAIMLFLSLANLAFVHLYPFPADVDADNLAHGVKNAYTMLGCILGIWLAWETDRRSIHFETKAPLGAQAVKLIAGFAILLGIKAGLKAPLYALTGGHYIADFVRYFLMVAFAGCLWPMTFPYWTKKFSK